MTIAGMNWVDIAILILICLSALIGVVRGFIREAFSLLFWILAFWVGFAFAKDASASFEHLIKNPSIRYLVAFLVLFVMVLFVGSIINFILVKLVHKTGLSGTDRLLGFVFGILRGVLIVALLLLLAKGNKLDTSTWWQNSHIIPYFKEFLDWLQSLIPASVAAYLTPEGLTAKAVSTARSLQEMQSVTHTVVPSDAAVQGVSNASVATSASGAGGAGVSMPVTPTTPPQ